MHSASHHNPATTVASSPSLLIESIPANLLASQRAPSQRHRQNMPPPGTALPPRRGSGNSLSKHSPAIQHLPLAFMQRGKEEQLQTDILASPTAHISHVHAAGINSGNHSPAVSSVQFGWSPQSISSTQTGTSSLDTSSIQELSPFTSPHGNHSAANHTAASSSHNTSITHAVSSHTASPLFISPIGSRLFEASNHHSSPLAFSNLHSSSTAAASTPSSSNEVWGPVAQYHAAVAAAGLQPDSVPSTEVVDENHLGSAAPLPDLSAFDHESNLEKKKRQKRVITHPTFPPGTASAAAAAALQYGGGFSVPASLSSSHGRPVCPDTPVKSPNVSKLFHNQTYTPSQPQVTHVANNSVTSVATTSSSSSSAASISNSSHRPQVMSGQVPAFLSNSARSTSSRPILPNLKADLTITNNNHIMEVTGPLATIPAALSQSLPYRNRSNSVSLMSNAFDMSTPAASSSNTTPFTASSAAFIQPQFPASPSHSSTQQQHSLHSSLRNNNTNSRPGSGTCTPRGKRKSRSGDGNGELLVAALGSSPQLCTHSGANSPASQSQPDSPSSECGRSKRQIMFVPQPPNSLASSFGNGSTKSGFQLANQAISEAAAAAAAASSNSSNSSAFNAAASQSGSYFRRHFLDCGEIGRGSFGVCYHVVEYSSEHEFAVKKSLKSFRGENDRAQKMKEVENWKRIMNAAQADQQQNQFTVHTVAADAGQPLIPTQGDHLNLVQYYGAWEETGSLYIQSELLRAGTMRHFLDEGLEESIDENLLWVLILDLTRGLRFVHEKAQLAHLDLKWENTFIDCDRGSIKIGDFGSSFNMQERDLRLQQQALQQQQQVQQQHDSHASTSASSSATSSNPGSAPTSVHMLSSASNSSFSSNAQIEWNEDSLGAPSATQDDIQEGDQKYLAPELLDSSLLQGGKVGGAADIFSLGVMLFEAACDVSLPRSGHMWLDLRHSQTILAEFFENEVKRSRELKDLIRWMLARSPANRPTASQILAHPRLVALYQSGAVKERAILQAQPSLLPTTKYGPGSLELNPAGSPVPTFMSTAAAAVAMDGIALTDFSVLPMSAAKTASAMDEDVSMSGEKPSQQSSNDLFTSSSAHRSHPLSFNLTSAFEQPLSTAMPPSMELSASLFDSRAYSSASSTVSTVPAAAMMSAGSGRVAPDTPLVSVDAELNEALAAEEEERSFQRQRMAFERVHAFDREQRRKAAMSAQANDAMADGSNGFEENEEESTPARNLFAAFAGADDD